jgi:enoyl-CoA hydratase/carnithine racemase
MSWSQQQCNFETLEVSLVEQRILVVALNRPQTRNALSTRMGTELMSFFTALALSPGDFRCVVLTGKGDKAFCAGGDLKERNGMTDQQWNTQHLIFERMIRAIMECPLPLVGAINGAAYGGGCEIAAACDFLYAAEHVRFALTEVTLGIMPGCGGTQNLPRAIGERRAKELLLSGEPFTAVEAQAWGFVNRVLPHDRLMAESLAVARKIAFNAPIATRQIKQSVTRGLQMSVSDGMAFEIEAYNRLISTADRREGIQAFNERRRPNFVGC